MRAADEPVAANAPDSAARRMEASRSGAPPRYHPVADFRVRGFAGYEAHVPAVLASLTDIAACTGVSEAAMFAACAAAVDDIVRMHLPGRLFLGVAAESLFAGDARATRFRSLLAEHGCDGRRIVVDWPDALLQLPTAGDLLRRLRDSGCEIAVYGGSPGFGDPRLWREVRPEFVRVGSGFTQGVANDRIRFQYVRAMQALGECSNAALIAEAVDDPADLDCLVGMGVACAWGEAVSAASAQPSTVFPAALAGRGETAESAVQAPAAARRSARELANQVAPVQVEITNEEAFQRFEADPSLDVLPVLSGTRPVGLINRHKLIDRLARPYRRELYGRRSCQQFMDPAPLIVDQHATVQELAMMLALAPRHYLFDGFIVAADGAYVGVGNSHDLIATITEMQISAARYANPLTQLPGNVPINDHIDSLLAAGESFVAAYLDIDAFKPFNDTFGYRLGDDVILLLAAIVREEVDSEGDFVGHIGGDDFFVVFRSADWEARCAGMIRRFGEAVTALAPDGGDENRCYLAENRRGEIVRHALPSLSIGAVRVSGGDFESHRELAAVAADAKKQAKKLGKREGHSRGALFVERRQAASGCEAAL